MSDIKKKNEGVMDMDKLYERSIVRIEEGQIVKGTIVEITPKEVVVDIGYKSEGVISLNEFSNPEEVKVGDEIDVFIENTEDEEGMVVVSKEKADQLRGWQRIVETKREGDVIDGRVARRV